MARSTRAPRSLPHRLELAALVNPQVLQAPVRADVPRLGRPGLRAPNGFFAFDVPAWPPSKSNNYEIVDAPPDARTGRRHKTLRVTEPVREFERQMARAIRAAYDRHGLSVEWFVAPRTVKPRAVDPIFGADVEVDVTVYLYERYRTNRDTDGVWKVLNDVGTACGLFADDVQVGDTATRRADLVLPLLDRDTTRVELRARPRASWERNPGGRPVSTAAAQRLAEHAARQRKGVA